MKGIFRQAIMISLVLLIVCGIAYPFAVTGLGQVLFHKQANGSMISYNGRNAGSELLGQDFTDTRFFHGRVSSIKYNTYSGSDKNNKGVTSGSSNLAPSNKALEDRIKNDIDTFLKTHPGITKEQIPADLLTNSGSGLDPDISPQAARIQIPQISATTGISTADLEAIVNKCTKGRSLGIFGEPRVNVLDANLEIAKRLNIK